MPLPTDQTISFDDAVLQGFATDLNDVADQVLTDIFGSAVSNVTYTGSGSAAFVVDEFDIAGTNIDFDDGLFLSSGGFPGDENTSGSFTIINDQPGDADLDVVASDAFAGAGVTQDAAVLEFDLFIDDPDIDGLRFDLVFGSDEFPEFSDTSFVDVAAVFVNGQNTALFDGDPATPLSVIDANLVNNNFIDNTTNAFPTEWDGFGGFSVRPDLQQGTNTIKIAIADTGDGAYDSGLFLTNFELLSEGATGGNTFVVVNGSPGDNDLVATASQEEFNLADGPGSVCGLLIELDSDIITGFDELDVLIIKNEELLPEQITITFGSAIIEIDADMDGNTDSTITLEGDFDGAEFSVETVNGDTEITVEFEDDAPEGSGLIARIADLLNLDEFLFDDAVSLDDAVAFVQQEGLRGTVDYIQDNTGAGSICDLADMLGITQQDIFDFADSVTLAEFQQAADFLGVDAPDLREFLLTTSFTECFFA